MITPRDIETKEFSKTLRGFNPDEVDDFLGEIYLTLQQLINENDLLNEKVRVLTKDMEKYHNSEKSVANTIESAKKLMNDISESAERRAEIIIKNAQLDAEVIQRDAKESVARMTEEGERLKQKVNRYRERYRQLLEDELNELDGSSMDLFAELEKEFMPASMTQALPTQKNTAPINMVHTQPQSPVRIEKKTAPIPRATIVVDNKSIDEILKENYGVGQEETVKVATKKEDLTKTRIF
ncbi:MAG: DivIVA domain-containing protein [Spirochaetaceae bacterium]|nr:DivIVA domain-containing protein [Spirochaetaceae bacterium]